MSQDPTETPSDPPEASDAPVATASPATAAPPAATSPAAAGPAATPPSTDDGLTPAERAERRRRRRKRLFWLAALAALVAAILLVRCGGGFGFGDGKGVGTGDGKRDDSGKGPAAPSTAVPQVDRCTLRVEARGVVLGDAVVELDAAVAACKPSGRADVIVLGDARQGTWDELKAALTAAGVAILERGAAPPGK